MQRSNPFLPGVLTKHYSRIHGNTMNTGTCEKDNEKYKEKYNEKSCKQQNSQQELSLINQFQFQ